MRLSSLTGPSVFSPTSICRINTQNMRLDF
uniref:Uncharacterized protein n=1 Tax=Anguilla anguilla TaxID=7936 RepID=A0A0E9PFY1_ANGAN